MPLTHVPQAHLLRRRKSSRTAENAVMVNVGEYTSPMDAMACDLDCAPCVSLSTKGLHKTIFHLHAFHSLGNHQLDQLNQAVTHVTNHEIEWFPEVTNTSRVSSNRKFGYIMSTPSQTILKHHQNMIETKINITFQILSSKKRLIGNTLPFKRRTFFCCKKQNPLVWQENTVLGWSK